MNKHTGDVWGDNLDRRANEGPSVDNLGRPDFQRSSHASLVKEYSRRDLSYSSDIVSAFTGVLLFIKAKEQFYFLFALRTRYFGNGLLSALWGCFRNGFQTRPQSNPDFRPGHGFPGKETSRLQMSLDIIVTIRSTIFSCAMARSVTF